MTTNPAPLLLIAAVEAEASLLRQLLHGAHTLECAQRPAWRGTLSGRDVVLLCCGIGKVNAAAATAVALERYAPRGVLCFGSAGAYSGSGLDIGDLALAHEEILADEGVEAPEQFLDFEALGFPCVSRPVRRYNRFPAPEKLLSAATDILSATAARLDIELRTVAALTVSSCSGTGAAGEKMLQRWQGGVENMEGGAVAQVCSAWGVPWLEVRSISNLVEDRDTSRWDLPRAARHAQEAVRALVAELPAEAWS